MEQLKEAVLPKLYRYLYHKNYIPHNIVKEYAGNTCQGDSILIPFAENLPVVTECAFVLKKPVTASFNNFLMRDKIKFSLLPELNSDILEAVYRKIKKNLEPQTNFIYETRCPECGKQASILAVLWQNQKISLYKYECSACKNCDMKELDQDDLDRVVEIEKFIFSFFMPDDIEKYFSRRNALALSSLFYAIEMMCQGEVEHLFKSVFFALIEDIYEDIQSDEYMQMNVFTYFELKFRQFCFMVDENSGRLSLNSDYLSVFNSFDELKNHMFSDAVCILPAISSTLCNAVLCWFSHEKCSIYKKQLAVSAFDILLKTCAHIKPGGMFVVFYHNSGKYEEFENCFSKMPLVQMEKNIFITTDLRGGKHECTAAVYKKNI